MLAQEACLASPSFRAARAVLFKCAARGLRTQRRCDASTDRFASLFRAGSPDGGFDVLPLFRRRKHRLDAE